MSDLRKALADLRARQEAGEHMPCPRCGKDTMKPALCTNALQAEMTRRHNDSNMLAIGAGVTGQNLAERIVDVFLTTEFEGGRHARRVDLMMSFEQE